MKGEESCIIVALLAREKRNKSCVAGFFMRERNVINHAPTAHAIQYLNTKIKRLGQPEGVNYLPECSLMYSS